MKTHLSTADVIRRYYAAYENKDRQAIEVLLADDFRFSSPRDDHIDRTAYLQRCWPNNERIHAFHIERLFVDGSEAFVLYLLEPTIGPTFRNTEFFRTAGGQVKEVEVYFGSPKGTVGD